MTTDSRPVRLDVLPATNREFVGQARQRWRVWPTIPPVGTAARAKAPLESGAFHKRELLGLVAVRGLVRGGLDSFGVFRLGRNDLCFDDCLFGLFDL